MPPGRYELGGAPIDLPEDGPPVRADGTLAGSALRLDTAIGNTTGLGVDLVTAVDAATRVPADLIGRADLGRIAPGAAADLVWLDDDLRARATWVAGELRFQEKL
jgi:N-acetylglucosamine-6-phosphate deacetylase